MHLHVRHLLETFCQKTTSLKVHIHLYCQKATDQPSVLEPRLKESGFDRIDVSNIADEKYKSLEPLLSTFGRLLKSPASNPDATLINIFMDEANLPEEATSFDINALSTSMQKVARFLPHRFSQPDPSDPATLRPLFSTDPVRRSDDVWNLIQEMINIPAYVENRGVKPKKENTVVEPWPTRLQKKDGDPGAQEELDRFGAARKYRFVEWVRNQ